MKNRNQLTLIFLAVFCSLFFYACGASHGGRNCDCPTFGSVQFDAIETLAFQSASVIFYLD